MTPTVERCLLGRDFSISRVLTGLWQIADMERDGRAVDLERASASMEPYVAAGFTTFDMADHYGSAELVAGTYRERRASDRSVQLCTKWVPKPGRVTRENVRAAVERGLERLRVDSIDLLQFHCWSYADPGWLDSLFALQEMKQEGLIRNLGLTNFDTAHLRVVVASGIDVVSNQVSFSLLDQRASGRMSDYCLAHGIKVLAYGTVAGGWLTDTWLGKAEPDWEQTGTWSQMKYGRFIRAVGGWAALQRVLGTAAVIAHRHGVSVANVASRFILEQPAVGGVIIGARLGAREHIADNLRLFSFSLNAEDRADIARTLESLVPLHGDTGDEYRKPPFLTASGDLSHHLGAMPAPYEVKSGGDGRSRCSSGTPWEPLAGYSRAVRSGNRIVVSGTTATHGDRLVGGSDAGAQMHFVIDKIEGALQSLGGSLEDVIRTRVFVRNIDDWESVARAHGERFGTILPANTLVRAELVAEQCLVEMEAEAEVIRKEQNTGH
jgi:aryl-alcohol dehydrogenase-like predicted oxidoreductase/enamine deaminase RidA (YjgF/YER057c/UK114 family)